MTKVFALLQSQRLDLEGRSKLFVKTTRKGSGFLEPLVVKSGLSFLRVFPPMIIASNPALKE